MKKSVSSQCDLLTIPGVGPSIAQDLINIGINNIHDLKNKNPEKLYQLSNQYTGRIQDKCLLYVFRCAVYFANTPPGSQETTKLKWWNWKNITK